MKNKLYQALLLIFLVAGISSCDYLDIVPDERPTEEDAFKDKNAAERYLYSCYAFMPKEREVVQSSISTKVSLLTSQLSCHKGQSKL